jgi:hypothetical protein
MAPNWTTINTQYNFGSVAGRMFYVKTEQNIKSNCGREYLGNGDWATYAPVYATSVPGQFRIDANIYDTNLLRLDSPAKNVYMESLNLL